MKPDKKDQRKYDHYAQTEFPEQETPEGRIDSPLLKSQRYLAFYQSHLNFIWALVGVYLIFIILKSIFIDNLMLILHLFLVLIISIYCLWIILNINGKYRQGYQYEGPESESLHQKENRIKKVVTIIFIIHVLILLGFVGYIVYPRF